MSAAPTASASTAWLFSYFTGNGEDGLRLAWSADGWRWQPLAGGRALVRPRVGPAPLLRDPHLARGPDGIFHLVWTTAWESREIGYASSPDLLTWSDQRALPVMAHAPDARNCWAPELAWDPARAQWLIFWSTTVRGRFPSTQATAENAYNHRIYATATRDFCAFAPTELFYDPGFNVIDATLVPFRGEWLMIVKDETIEPPRKHLRCARGRSPRGPWGPISSAFTRDWVEGPTAVVHGDELAVLFDVYRENHYGAVVTRDGVHWTDATARLSLPAGARHGTALAVPTATVERLRSALG